MFKKCLDIALSDVVSCIVLVVCGQLDWMILEVFSNLGNSVIQIRKLRFFFYSAL